MAQAAVVQCGICVPQQVSPTSDAVITGSNRCKGYRSSGRLLCAADFKAGLASVRYAPWLILEAKARTTILRLTKDDNVSSSRASSLHSTRKWLKFRCISESYEGSQQSPSSLSPGSSADTTDSISLEESTSTISEEHTNFTTEESKSCIEDSKSQEVQIDLNLPRRTLMAAFTCNRCQARTNRMINPNAYRRGTVYVQCAGCGVYHKLVDNLGLVVEYDFRMDAASDSEID